MHTKLMAEHEILSMQVPCQLNCWQGTASAQAELSALLVFEKCRNCFFLHPVTTQTSGAASGESGCRLHWEEGEAVHRAHPGAGRAHGLRGEGQRVWDRGDGLRDAHRAWDLDSGDDSPRAWERAGAYAHPEMPGRERRVCRDHQVRQNRRGHPDRREQRVRAAAEPREPQR